MSLPGTIVLRPNEFTKPGYSVVYKGREGRELDAPGPTSGQSEFVSLWVFTPHFQRALVTARLTVWFLRRPLASLSSRSGHYPSQSTTA